MGDHRTLQGLDPLLRADRDPRAHEVGRASTRRSTTSPRCASWARSASRSTRGPGSGTARLSAWGRRPVVDTWWQTETGAITILPLPGVTHDQPGSATSPLPGVEVTILDGVLEEEVGLEQAGSPRPHEAVAGDAADALQGQGALRRDVLFKRFGQVLPRRRRRGRTRSVTTGSSGGSTTCSTSRATGCRRRRSSRRSCPTRPRPRPRSSVSSDEGMRRVGDRVRDARGRPRGRRRSSARSVSTSPSASASSRGRSASTWADDLPKTVLGKIDARAAARHRGGPRARRLRRRCATPNVMSELQGKYSRAPGRRRSRRKRDGARR